MKEKEEGPLYEIDDDAPIYNIEDEIENGDGEQPEDEDSEDNKEDQTTKRKPSPFLIMFKTLITPVEGWKSLKRARFTSDEFASRCLYPLIALAALSEGAMFFYEPNVNFSDWVMKGLSTFISFFFGYFTIMLLAGILLPKGVRPIMKKDIGKQYVMLCLSTYALFWTSIILFPFIDVVLFFLPLWTIYIAVKGVKVLRVPKDNENSTAGILCFLIIGVPIFWNWFMNEILFPANGVTPV